MKCYYHDNREAVATCKCGKCLCRECADAHTPIMCSSCWSAHQKEIETNRVLIKRNEENAKKNIRNQLQSRLSLYLQYIQ